MLEMFPEYPKEKMTEIVTKNDDKDISELVDIVVSEMN